MSPQSLLAVYEKVNKQPAPPCYLLSVRGYEFGLGLSLSDKANSNIRQACDFIRDQLLSSKTEDWQQLKTGVVEKALN
jgi:hypothetical protein